MSMLTDGNTTIFWLAAVAAAGVGTVLVVAVYLRVNRIVTRLRAGRRNSENPAVGKIPGAGAVSGSEAVSGKAALAEPRGIAAYQAASRTQRSMATMSRQADFTREIGAPTEPVAEASLVALEELLGRLQTAAESLENLAGRAARPVSRPAGVKYLHRTV